MRSNILSVVPAKAGTHNPWRSCSGAAFQQGHSRFPHHRRHGVWVPAFAGTTKGTSSNQIDRASHPSGGDIPPPTSQVGRKLPCVASRGASARRGAFARSPPPPGCAGVAKRRTDGCPCARQCRRQRIRLTSSPRRCEGELDQRVLGIKKYAYSYIYIFIYTPYSQEPIPRPSRGRKRCLSRRSSSSAHREIPAARAPALSAITYKWPLTPSTI